MKKKITKKQYIKFGIVGVLYGLFILWMQNGWLTLGYIVLADIYLTKYIPWGAWKNVKNPTLRNALGWVDDIVFALVAVYFINIFLFQNYQIPSSSLEKSLLVGDYLFVSKASYGPRVPNTPLSFPLVQNTLPILNCKSYLEWPEWGYNKYSATILSCLISRQVIPLRSGCRIRIIIPWSRCTGAKRYGPTGNNSVRLCTVRWISGSIM